MTAAQRLASIARHWRFLGDSERTAFMPTSSECAVQRIGQRMTTGPCGISRNDLYCAVGVIVVALIFTLQIVRGWAT